MDPSSGAVVLIGGPFTSDTGEQLDSRQPFSDDPTSDIAQKALAGSELWWLTAASLVLPLLSVEGDNGFATMGGPRSVATVKPDGSIMRRRLTSVLPGGVRPKNPGGCWQMVDMGGLWEVRDTRIVVDTYGIFWRNAMAINSYTEFERRWMDGRNQILIGPHTYAAAAYFDGYVAWVADGRPSGDSGALLPNPDWYLSPDTPAVVPIDADFRITGIIQNGVQIDAGPVDAARTLLQARYDLKLGFWDLVTNDTLRTTLLSATPAAAPPSTPAPKTAGALKRHLERKEARSEEAKQYEDYLKALTDVVAKATPGWTSSLPGVAGDVGSPFRRALPFAFAPDCDETQASIRHPALRTGRPILWLLLEVVPGSWGRGGVQLIAPAPLNELSSELFWPFIEDNLSTLKRIAHPHNMYVGTTYGSSGVVCYQLAEFDSFPTEPSPKDWAARLHEVVRRAPAWSDAFKPLAEDLQHRVLINPRLGRHG